jgi:glycosyltransferase involved in cell wall biosynthesis
MKIFISIPWFLPAFKAGGPIRSIANMVGTYNSNVEYFIFCGSKDVDGAELQVSEFNTWISYSGNCKVWYASENATFALKQEFKKSGAGILYIVGIFDYEFNIVPLLKLSAAKKILSVRGMLHSGALSQKTIKKKLFLNYLKAVGVHKRIVFHATDDVEAAHVKNVFGNNVTVQVANNFAAAASNTIALIDKPIGFLKLVTVALISPMKNHLLVLEALMHCTANIEYTIYGAVKDDEYWYQCKSIVRELPKNIFVHYGGELSPIEVEAKLKENHVFVMPSKSENFGHAIAEALAIGKPVITSNNTPWVQLRENHAGVNVDFNAQVLASEINGFANLNNEEYAMLSKSALQYYILSQTNSPLMEQYRNLFSV